MSESPKKAKAAPQPAKVLQVQTEPATWLCVCCVDAMVGEVASACAQNSKTLYHTLSHWFPCWIVNIYIDILTSAEHGICNLSVQDAALFFLPSMFTQMMVLGAGRRPKWTWRVFCSYSLTVFISRCAKFITLFTTGTESSNWVEMEWNPQDTTSRKWIVLIVGISKVVIVPKLIIKETVNRYDTSCWWALPRNIWLCLGKVSSSHWTPLNKNSRTRQPGALLASLPYPLCNW